MWALIDDRIGNTNQTLGVAKALGIPFTSKTIKYNGLVKLPNVIRGRSLLGVVDSEKLSSDILSEKPELVVSSGRRLAPVAQHIKKLLPNTKIVSIMWPGTLAARDFNLIALPLHDKKTGANIVNTIGAPNIITPDHLECYKNGPCLNNFSHLQKPLIALLIGGNTKKGNFTKAHAQEILDKVISKGSLLVTTSRRTSSEVTNFIKDYLVSTKSSHYFYNGKGANPYLEFLANCDIIVVTGDSISMCSESCSTGKPVYIHSDQSFLPEKHIEFANNLFRTGYARPLSQEFLQDKITPCPTLSDAKTVADAIRKII